jgi:plasmid maintenance system antidote protein VapI
VTADSFACPCCGAVSREPNDVFQRYCGRCHDWTGDPQLGPPHLARHCPHRPFLPDWTLHPGVALRAVLRHREISEADLADRARLGPETIGGILGGTMAVDGLIAQRLEEALGRPGAQFWLNFQAGYEADLARGAKDTSEEHDG